VKRIFASIFFLCILSSSVSAAPLILVDKGKPALVIVTADNPSQSARQGASDLKHWIKLVSGADIDIFPESQTETRAYSTKKTAVILVGDTQRGRKLGLDPNNLGLEEVEIKTFPGVLAIMGDDQRPDGFRLDGTAFAVNVFAKKYLGVRFLWPGELGEAAPMRETVKMETVSYKFKPSLRKREIRHGMSAPDAKSEQFMSDLGWNKDGYAKLAEEAPAWYRFHGIGGSLRGDYGHSYLDWWGKYGETHPEWFALQPDGTRNNSRGNSSGEPVGSRSQFCVSNRELIEEIARDRIAQLRNNPSLDFASISPNDDGGPTYYCLCDKCRALDDPKGEKITINAPGKRIEIVSLTDRYVKFYSAIAELVAKELPDRRLGAYAYNAYELPPVHAKLNPNVVIGFVPYEGLYLREDHRAKMRESWLAWSQAANQLFLRPNFLMGGHSFPAVFVHRMDEDIRFFADHQMMFTDFDCNFMHWSTNGINYYVLAELLWDPYQKVDDIVNDYCRAGFGPAAEAIRSYFYQLEKITTNYASRNTYHSYYTPGRNPEELAAQYPDKAVADLRARLDEADRLAGNNGLIKKRIQFLRTGLDFTPVIRDYLIARADVRKGQKDAQAKLDNARSRREAWFKTNGYSWALGIGPIMRYDF
jgi:hypothetical protein